MADTFITEAYLKDKRKELNERRAEPLKSVKFNQKVTHQSQQSSVQSLDNMEDMKERQWKKQLEKICFNPNREDYYSNHIVKPSFYFYKALAMSTYPIEKLKVNIPETYIALDNTYWIYPEDGRMNKISDVSYQEFEQSLEKQYAYIYGNRPDVPFMISRMPGAADHLCSKLVYTLNSLKENRLYNAENNSMFQRFILPKGFQATILRLVYHTGNSRENKANYAFRIKNNLGLFDKNPKITQLHKCTLNSDKPYSFFVNELKGNSLKEYELTASRVVHYLERSYNVRITKVVFDYMTDFEDKTWLINMKSIELENVAPFLMQQEELGAKKTLDSLTCSVYCKLCGLIFKKDDASKTLTYKLLWELIQHLKKRGIFLKDITVTHNSTRPCRVCDLCYMLAVSEHELIDVEQKFARAQKIPIADALVRVPTDHKPTHRPALLNEDLYQWRLVVFLHSVNNLELDNAYFDPKNIQLHYKFFNQKSVFKMHYVPPYDETKNKPSSPDLGFQSSTIRSASPTSTKVQKMLEQRGEITFPKKKKASGLYAINSMRVHYLFSETMDIQKFFDETEICMRIVRGNDWNNFFAEGKTTSIKYFKKNWEKGQTHQAQTLCFFENGRYCTVKAIFGLVCDGKINTELMNLYKHNNVYLPDENFYNSNPFPMEWMEIFEKKDILIDEEYEDKNAEKIYSPKCSSNDINKMVELPGTRARSKMNEVESVVKRSWSANRLKNSNTLGNQYGEKSSTLHPFKFTTLTDTAKSINKPTRIYSAQPKKFNSSQALKPLEATSARSNQVGKKIGGDVGSEENLENEIEILSFLTKRPQSHLNAREAKAAQNQISYLQSFEKQLKVFEDNDLINKYADGGDDSLGNAKPEKKGPYNERIYTENAEEDDENETENERHNKHVLEASDHEEDDQVDEPPKQISHKEFASMIDALKSKALETI